MRHRIGAVAGSIALMAGLAFGAFAADKSEEAPALKKYKRTGEYTNCLKASRINSTQILNDHQILFQMLGGDDYLAEPKTGCSGLQKNLALLYDPVPDQLCNTTIIKLVEPSSPVPHRGTCAIDRFERLEKKPKEG